jgi:hypothetical protein
MINISKTEGNNWNLIIYQDYPQILDSIFWIYFILIILGAVFVVFAGISYIISKDYK